jgi:signal transduction histidine kinase
MSDEVDAEARAEEKRRRKWWPQTVRVRLTIVATLAFAITISAAAFGLVRLVHNNLVDRIEETNQSQLDYLQRQVDSGELTPKSQQVCYLQPGRNPICQEQPPDRGDFEEAQRQIDTQVGRITLVSQQSTAAVNRTTDSVTNVLLIVVPAMIALVALAAWYLAGRALKPVEAIRLEAESITGTTMHRRVPEPATDDEVGRLARTMNAMLSRLETSAQKQRQFVSDASHELRSPLASIRTNLEVALHNADRADWPEVAQRALVEDVRMEDTVSELLDLARLDEAEGPVLLDSLPEVDLDELVLDDTVQQRRVPVDTGRVSAGRVHGRREQLQRVVRNLLDNAARHATSTVAVGLVTGD